jgi:septal ring factor EnvC (AmiA/AmiB activator)
MSTSMSDADLETVASCIQQFHRVSSLEWTRMEIDAAERSLSRLQASAETIEKESENGNNFVASCIKKLMEADNLTMQQLAKSKNDAAMPSLKNKRKLRRRRLLSQMEEEMAEIMSLEEQLAEETDRLRQARRAKRIFDTQLEMERSGPVAAALSKEVLSSVGPGPASDNGSDVLYSLLDDSAQVGARIADPDEGGVPSNESRLF